MKTWNGFRGVISNLLHLEYNQVAKDRLLRACIGLLLLTAFSSMALGQNSSRLDRYTKATFSGTFNTISSSYSSVGSGDDGVFLAGTLPFSFNFDSSIIASGSSIYIGDNGTMGLGTSATGACCSNNLGVSSYPNNILPHSMDMYVDGTGAGLFYSGALGSAPNRYVILEWSSIRAYSGNGNHTSMQVILYETKNRIEMIFKDHSFAFGNSAGGCGLNGGTTYGFKSLSYESSSSTPSSDVRFDPALPPIPPTQLSLSPKSINFGGVSAGTFVTSTITAYSVGANNLHIIGYALSGAVDYTMITAPLAGDSILVGQSQTYTVKFQPVTAGNRNATFTLFTDGRDSGTQSTSLTGIGLAPSVSYGASSLFRRVFRRLGDTSAVQYIPMTSTGTGPLTINSIYLIGLNPENYTISYMPQNPLPVGRTDSIGIRFTPKLEGRPDASVVISTNAYNIPYDTVSLWGIGTLARLVVQPPPPSFGTGTNVTMSFDSVAIGDSVCRSLTLQNTGADTLQILRQTVTSTDYDYSFYPLTGADTMILPGQTKLINICFRPLKVGTRVATFRLFTNIPKTFETPRRDTSQFNVNIAGVGVAFGRLVVSGQFVDSTLVGQTSTPCIFDTVVNTGQTDLIVSGASISGPFASDYALTWPGGAPSFTLVPGASRVVQICFTPGDRGPRTVTLKLTGSTSGELITDSVQIYGFGLHECTTPIPVVLYDTVLIGSKHSNNIAVQNCGDVNSTQTAALSATTNAAFALTGTTVQPEGPGATANYNVDFTPITLGMVTGALNITGPGVLAGTSVALNGYGTGVLPVGSSQEITVAKGDCRNDTITFTNNGNVNWTPGSITLGGADKADFTVVGTGITPSVVPPGGTATVVLSFCPTTTAKETVTIDFPSSVPGASLVAGNTVPYTVNADGAVNSVAQRSAQDGFVLGQSYPNPTTATAQVSLSLPKDAAVRVDLVDATGTIVRNAFSGRLSQGDHTLSIDAKGLPSGTYYYVLTSGDIRLARQIVLVK